MPPYKKKSTWTKERRMPGLWSNSNGGPSGPSGYIGPNESSVAVAMRIIIVGNSSVGKTSVLSRFLGRHHGPAAHTAHTAYGASDHWHHGPTIGVDFGIKVVKVRGRPVKLQMYDTAGQEMYRSIASAYFRKAAGCIAMFDITNRQSFE